MAWYNTYRPQSFLDVIGQETVKDVLQKSLQRGLIKHAYLFSGSKGIGKTTIARIFAAELTQTAHKPENSIDIIELDAASHTGIDDIRILIESSTTPPISSPYKVFIIDEVHMLSKPAMNALLKTLEEPPSYLVFLLATTNPEKLIPTVLSRLTHFKLYNHTQAQLVSRLSYIANQEGLVIDAAVLDIIAKRSKGSQRDAINELETISSYQLQEYNMQTVAPILGIADSSLIENIVNELATTRTVTSALAQEAAHIGIDGVTLLNQMLEFCLDEQLSGNTQYQSVITPIFETLNARFPLVSVYSCLALVQSRFKEVPITSQVPVHTAGENPTRTSTYNNTTSELRESQAEYVYTPQQEKLDHSGEAVQEEKVSNIHSEPDNPKIAQNKLENDNQNTESASLNMNNAVEHVSNDSVSTNDIQDYLLLLMNNNDSNAVVKMILPDIRIESVEGTHLKATSSNGLFLARLNHDSFKKWFTQKLNERFGIVYICEFTTRTYQTPITPLYDEVDELVHVNDEYDDSSASQYEDEFVPLSNQSSNTISEPQPTVSTIQKVEESHQKVSETTQQSSDTKSYFYSVYKELPPEINDSKLPVKNSQIELPPELDSTHDEWSQSADDMFDFE